MKIEHREWLPPAGGAPQQAIVLRQSHAQMVLVPERGGKIVSLANLSREQEWLWLNEGLPWIPATPDDSYVKQHDLGGWDECFPTISPTVIGGSSWPDHGDLWWRPWRAEVQGDQLWMEVEGASYRFQRVISGIERGFRFEYRVWNTSRQSLPYLWSAHPLLCIDPPLTIELIGRPSVRLAGDCTLGRANEQFVWPDAGGRALTHVGKSSGLAAKLFVAVEVGEVLLRRRDGGTLQIRWPETEVPMLGMWINEGGWSGTHLPPYSNLGIEPASGAPDDLRVALNDWHCAKVLPAGGEDRWWVEVILNGEDSE